MKGFLLVERAQIDEVKKRYPVLINVAWLNNFIPPYKNDDILLNEVKAGTINITKGLEGGKLKTVYNKGMNEYGYVLSKEYGINYNPFFYHSCLIRGLDFYTISLGCDMRLNEVVIADAASPEGRNVFRLLLPIVRRIVLVTKRKKELEDEVNYAIMRYGTSVAIVEDPVRASERADVVILSSKDRDHRYLAQVKKPMLFIKYLFKPETELWFEDISVGVKGIREINPLYAQGYVDCLKKPPIWKNAESKGFTINALIRGKMNILEM